MLWSTVREASAPQTIRFAANGRPHDSIPQGQKPRANHPCRGRVLSASSPPRAPAAASGVVGLLRSRSLRSLPLAASTPTG